MANDYLKRGDFNALCDVCGFKFKGSMLRRRWDNLMVCQADYELRNPQDYLKVPKDNPAPPWTRPEADNTYVQFNILTEGSDNLITELGDNIATEFG